MKRPMPPELVALGDQLEAAAARALNRRRARRQLVMNAAVSLVVAVPLTLSVALTQVSTTTVVAPTPTPTVTAQPVAELEEADRSRATQDFLPRDFRRMRLTPQAELLVLPSSLRPALR